MNIRVISDLHLGHESMARHRGFIDSHQMNQVIVENWNRVVTSPKDITFILGDITMEKTKDYYLLDYLMGVKHVILGNHDKRQHVPEILKHVDTVCGSYYDKKRGIIFSHIPVHPSEINSGYSWNIHGHCVDEYTEILTPNGWLNYTELEVGMKTYSLDTDSLKLEEDSIKKIIVNKEYTGSMYHLKSRGIDMMVTDEHMIPHINNKNKKIVMDTANNVFQKNLIKIIRSGNVNREGVPLSNDILKLYISLCADGNITPAKLARFNLKKERKITFIKELLKDLGIEYTLNESYGMTRINFRLPKELYDFNIKGLDKKLLNCTKDQVAIIKETYSVTDGNRDLIFTSKKEEVDLLSHLFVINGYKCKMHSRTNHGFSKNKSYQLSITEGTTQYVANVRRKVTKVDNYKGLVWCIVQTSNHNFIARRNGSVFLTGNCHLKSLDDKRYINVSAEVVNYTPVLLEDLR